MRKIISGESGRSDGQTENHRRVHGHRHILPMLIVALHLFRLFPLLLDVMNADGSGQTRLTNDPADDSAPAWSTDGTQIAFESDRDGKLVGCSARHSLASRA